MTFDERSLEHAPTATSPIWLAPLAMLVAWLAALLNLISRMKRVRHATRFKPDWRDHWDGLRRSEWQRDQMLAQGAALLLSGKTFDDADCVLIPEPPADYGGPCPRTPFQMNRRFLALAEFMKDPETAIRRHAARIARRSSTPAAHGSTDAARSVRLVYPEPVEGSNHAGVRANARGPPESPRFLPSRTLSAPPAPPARSHPHVRALTPPPHPPT